MDHDLTAQVATGAIWAAWAVFGALCLAVLGAACSALPDGTLPGVGMGLVSGLCVALRLFFLVPVFVLLGRVLVTYVHTYRGQRGTGRRYRGYGRRSQGPGRHRAIA